MQNTDACTADMNVCSHALKKCLHTRPQSKTQKSHRINIIISSNDKGITLEISNKKKPSKISYVRKF